MLRPLERHAQIFAYSGAMMWTTCCSVYDAALLADAQGDASTVTDNSDGGKGTGGKDNSDPGDGGDAGSGSQSSSGSQSGGDGDSAGGGDSGSGGDADPPSSGGVDGSGGDANGGGCAMGDCCPDDPDKDEPGECGCDVADVDSDGDLTADCNDLCPAEPTKTEPGDCGCDVSATDEAKCSVLKNGILHRYSFEGSGTEATDSIGSQNGTIQNGGVQGGGVITLDGTDQYVDLPSGMISTLTDATFEVWFTWNGGGDYQRLFDFGHTTGSPAVGESYLYLAASKVDEGPGSGFSLNGNASEVETEATSVIDTGTQYHLVLVVDETEGAIKLYIDGAFQSGIAFTSSLTNVSDVNCYLGRSLFEADAYLNGSIDELRIYDVALSSSQIAYSYAQGGDASIFE